jgi:hypothetical protein
MMMVVRAGGSKPGLLLVTLSISIERIPCYH